MKTIILTANDSHILIENIGINTLVFVVSDKKVIGVVVAVKHETYNKKRNGYPIKDNDNDNNSTPGFAVMTNTGYSNSWANKKEFLIKSLIHEGYTCVTELSIP